MDNTKKKISRQPSGTILEVPQVMIAVEVWKKIVCYVEEAYPDEISGVGIVERIGNDFLVSEVVIIKQRVSGTSAELDPLALAEFVSGHPNPENIFFQWHSHAGMPAFFSSTDLETIDNYFTDMMISFVTNRNGEYECRLDIMNPVRVAVRLPVSILVSAGPEMVGRYAKEVGEKLTRTHAYNLLKNEKPIPKANEIGFILHPENLKNEGG